MVMIEQVYNKMILKECFKKTTLGDIHRNTFISSITIKKYLLKFVDDKLIKIIPSKDKRFICYIITSKGKSKVKEYKDSTTGNQNK